MAEREDIALELARDICRELYDRFVMGGWEPQDAHEQVAALLRPHVEFEQRYRQLLWESHAGYSHSKRWDRIKLILLANPKVNVRELWRERCGAMLAEEVTDGKS